MAKKPVTSHAGRKFEVKPNGLVSTSKVGIKCHLEERALRAEKRKLKKKSKIKKL